MFFDDDDDDDDDVRRLKGRLVMMTNWRVWWIDSYLSLFLDT